MLSFIFLAAVQVSTREIQSSVEAGKPTQVRLLRN